MNFATKWDVEGTAAYLRDRGFTRPALQFPDEYLGDCKLVAEAVQRRCQELSHSIQAGALCSSGPKISFEHHHMHMPHALGSDRDMVALPALDEAAVCATAAGVRVGGHFLQQLRRGRGRRRACRRGLRGELGQQHRDVSC